jgi:hypothetical protein
MGTADEQTVAELKAQNDRLMSERVITRNLLKAQSKRTDKLEQKMAAGEVTSTINNNIKAIADAVVKSCDGWLEGQHAMWQRACDDTFRACFLTDQMYNSVMAALPSPSVLDAVLSSLAYGLAIVNPELSMLSVVLEVNMPGKKEQKERRLKTAGPIKELLVAGFEKGKEAVEKGEEEERDRHESMLDAKIKFFQDQMDACSESSSWITECFLAFKRVLGPVPAEQAVAVTNGLYAGWRIVVGDGRPYHHGQVKQLSLLFLYDLLRAYCEENVHVKIKTLRSLTGGYFTVAISKAKAMQIVADDDELIELDGLDSAKQAVMFKLFEDIERLGPKRPKITNLQDLINNWDFAT